MAITYQVENWLLVKQEASSLWPAHWREVGHDREHLKLDVNIDLLDVVSQSGRLHIVTVRSDGKLVGYHSSFIEHLIRYKTILASQGDVYWLDPSFRQGIAGGRIAVGLFQAVERTCRERGVQVLFNGYKLSNDHGPLFKHLGYRSVEMRVTKWIGS